MNRSIRRLGIWGNPAERVLCLLISCRNTVRKILRSVLAVLTGANG
jgi:hypothetical protein